MFNKQGKIVNFKALCLIFGSTPVLAHTHTHTYKHAYTHTHTCMHTHTHITHKCRHTHTHTDSGKFYSSLQEAVKLMLNQLNKYNNIQHLELWMQPPLAVAENAILSCTVAYAIKLKLKEIKCLALFITFPPVHTYHYHHLQISQGLGVGGGGGGGGKKSSLKKVPLISAFSCH